MKHYGQYSYIFIKICSLFGPSSKKQISISYLLHFYSNRIVINITYRYAYWVTLECVFANLAAACCQSMTVHLLSCVYCDMSSSYWDIILTCTVMTECFHFISQYFCFYTFTQFFYNNHKSFSSPIHVSIKNKNTMIFFIKWKHVVMDSWLTLIVFRIIHDWMSCCFNVDYLILACQYNLIS